MIGIVIGERRGRRGFAMHASKSFLRRLREAYDETEARFHGGVHEFHRGQQRLHVFLSSPITKHGLTVLWLHAPRDSGHINNRDNSKNLSDIKIPGYPTDGKPHLRAQ
jgi:hypothetical protein